MTTNGKTEFTQEDVNVSLLVKLSVPVTLGLYSGPVSKGIIAENVKAMLDSDTELFIDCVEIVEVTLDDMEVLVTSVKGAMK